MLSARLWSNPLYRMIAISKLLGVDVEKLLDAFIKAQD